MSSTEAKKLRAALARIATTEGSAKDKAALLREHISNIARGSDGTWQATELPGDDGAYVFAGRLGEIIVITPDGTVYRGRLGRWPITTKGIKLDYAELQKV